MNRYRLLTKHQRRGDGTPRRYPIAGLEFCGGEVVETKRNLSKWVGVLIAVVNDKPEPARVPLVADILERELAPAPEPKPEPAPEPAPEPESAPEPDIVALADGLAPETEVVPEPAPKRRARRTRKKVSK